VVPASRTPAYGKYDKIKNAKINHFFQNLFEKQLMKNDKIGCKYL